MVPPLSMKKPTRIQAPKSTPTCSFGQAKTRAVPSPSFSYFTECMHSLGVNLTRGSGAIFLRVSIIALYPMMATTSLSRDQPCETPTNSLSLIHGDFSRSRIDTSQDHVLSDENPSASGSSSSSDSSSDSSRPPSDPHKPSPARIPLPNPPISKRI